MDSQSLGTRAILIYAIGIEGRKGTKSRIHQSLIYRKITVWNTANYLHYLPILQSFS